MKGEPVEVAVRDGRLRGQARDGLEIFLGVPYARPPVGPLRLRRPRPVEPWSGVRPALSFGSVAPQLATAAPIRALARRIGAGIDEDCLYLNIWAPAEAGPPRPVMVWLHGGGFFLGAGSRFLYSGRELARRGVVVVTLNYRLGALGFLDLSAQGGNRAPANLGLRDQIAALEWVRDNIRAFGGDPDRVTLFGESAGAMSAAVLLALDLDLFRRVILQSGAASAVSTPEQAAEVADLFLAAAGVTGGDPERLRRLSLRRILAAQRAVLADSRRLGRLPWQPSIDGDLLAGHPLDAILAGAGREIDLLLGTNRDEWRLFTAGSPMARLMGHDRLRRRIERWLSRREASPAAADRVIEVLRRESSRRRPRAFDLWCALRTEEIFRRPAIELANRHAGERRRTFLYRFDLELPALRRSLGACHAAELPLVFGSFDHPALRPIYLRRPAVRRLSDLIQEAWLAFARDGVPAAGELPSWPAWNPRSRRCLILGSSPRVETGLDDGLAAIWGELSSGSSPDASS